MTGLRLVFATFLVGGSLALVATRGEAVQEPVLDELEHALSVSRTRARAAARVMPAVCMIRALGKGRDGYGAGVFVAPDGHMLTALHVVQGATALSIVLHDGSEVPGRVVALDSALDLALVQALDPKRAFVTARFGRDDELMVGDEILAVGNPYGVGITVTRGILSARDRRQVVKDNAAPLLQTDAAINPGSSGGALVNLRGEVVGLVTAILTRSGGSEGVGFAVPARVLQRALPALREGRQLGRAWLGLRVVPGEHGLKVTGTTADSPAAKAGFVAGDRVTSVDSTKVETVEQLREAVEKAGVGAEVTVHFLRDGVKKTCQISIAPRKP